MDKKENYFQDEYSIDKKAIEKINKIIDDQEILNIFKIILDDSFLYELENDKSINNKPIDKNKKSSSCYYSFSTNSMTLFTLAYILNLFEKESVFIAPFNYNMNIKIDDNLEKNLIINFINVFTTLIQKFSESEDDKKNRNTTTSNTFGVNDPFTITWIICTIIAYQNMKIKYKSYDQNWINDNDFYNFKNEIIKIAKEICIDALTNLDNPVIKENKSIKNNSLNHIFPRLRIIQLFKILTTKKEFKIDRIDLLENIKLKNLAQYLTYNLHLQLSYSDIPESPYDSAELIFSLEGLLLINKFTSRQINSNVIIKVFKVIKEKQQESPYWRPLRPFVTTSQGLILLPLSVEIANSLLRITKLLDDLDILSEKIYTSYISVFKIYANWLLMRITKINIKYNNEEIRCMGWHSEHIDLLDRIHPWETVQALLFIINYHILLQKRISKLTLKNINLSEKNYSNKDAITIDKIKNNYEPMLNLSDNYLIYSNIEKYYINPRIDNNCNDEKMYSILLYGPPGTGKTSLAKNIAMLLDWKLIVITPSDFIRGGTSEVEHRAKLIFNTLEEQENIIVLFDEIDRLILDRDSSYYDKQGDFFQFMTPSMLIKFNDLRSKKKIIFIINTNYEERIDNAIKRKGRIDNKYILLPPNYEQRKNIITNTFDKNNKKIESKNEFRVLLNKTVLSTYGEIKQLFTDNNFEINKLKEKVEEPQIRLLSYKSRFFSKYKPKEEKYEEQKGQKPFEEFLLLTYLKIEKIDLKNKKNLIINNIFNKEECDLMKQVFKILIIDNSNIDTELSKVIKCKDIIDKIKELFTIINIP